MSPTIKYKDKRFPTLSTTAVNRVKDDLSYREWKVQNILCHCYNRSNQLILQEVGYTSPVSNIRSLKALGSYNNNNINNNENTRLKVLLGKSHINCYPDSLMKSI